MNKKRAQTSTKITQGAATQYEAFMVFVFPLSLPMASFLAIFNDA